MAKNDPVLRTNSEIVHIASIHWFQERNLARQSGDYGKLDDLKASLAENGWKLTGDGTIDVEPITPELRDRALAERTDQWESLKLTAKADPNQRLALSTFEEIYVDKGKLRDVHFAGVSGNRRSRVYFAAMVDRVKNKESVSVEIPVKIMKFESDLDRLDVQIGENEGKMSGFLEMSSVDRLKAAKKAVEFGANQARLRKSFKDGTGQKLWGVLLLDKRFPELEIFKRMTEFPPEDPRHIKFGAQSTKELASLVLRTDATELDEKNKNLRLQGREQLKPATVEEVADYFGNPKKGGNEPKIMIRDTIKGLSESFPALPLRAAFKAVMNATTDGLKPYDNASMGLNAIDSLIGDGDYPPVEFLLVKIIATPKDKRDELIKRLHAALEPSTNGQEAKKPVHAGSK